MTDVISEVVLGSFWLVVQNSLSKINKLINYLIGQIFLLTYITTFEPETPAGHPKYQKTRIVA